MLLSPEDQVALNETKMRRMFATPKKVRKKARSQVLAQTTPKEQTPAKASLTKSRPQQVSDPVTRVNQNSEGNSAANPVNLLQVRKKRKASPVVAPAAATSAAHALQTTSSTSASSAPLTSSAPAHGTETTVRDQVSPSSELVSVETQPTEAPPTEEHTRGSGTVDGRLSM